MQSKAKKRNNKGSVLGKLILTFPQLHGKLLCKLKLSSLNEMATYNLPDRTRELLPAECAQRRYPWLFHIVTTHGIAEPNSNYAFSKAYNILCLVVAEK